MLEGVGHLCGCWRAGWALEVGVGVGGRVGRYEASEVGALGVRDGCWWAHGGRNGGCSRRTGRCYGALGGRGRCY